MDMRRTAVTTLIALAFPFSALATDEGAAPAAPGLVELGSGAMTYELFESTVEHADLAECPAGLGDENSFCRLTLASDMLHVFVFSLDGNQPLLAVASFDPTEEGGLPF